MLQGGPEKMLLETIDSFIVNSNFCTGWLPGIKA